MNLAFRVRYQSLPIDMATTAAQPLNFTLPIGVVVQGPKGDPGINDFVGTFVAGQDIAAGQPVYISRQNRLLMVADSSTYLSAFVIGFAVADIPSGFAGDVKKGVFTLSDWTALTGASALQPGFPYFLNGPGTLSTSPPISGGFISIGEATSSQSLLFKPTFPIQL